MIPMPAISASGSGVAARHSTYGTRRFCSLTLQLNALNHHVWSKSLRHGGLICRGASGKRYARDRASVRMVENPEVGVLTNEAAQ
jgi:hypothetical protein